VTTAATTGSGMPGLYPVQNGYRVNVDNLMPIHVLESFYYPIVQEKRHELEKVSNRVKTNKKEKYKVSRELKNFNI